MLTHKIFHDLFDKYKNDTMVPQMDAYYSYLAANYVGNNNIKGCVVECGVYRGGLTMIMAETIEKHSNNSLDREYYLLDTFLGMPEPSKEDFKLSLTANNNVDDVIQHTKDKYLGSLNDAGKSSWCLGEIEEVKKTISKSGIDINKFFLIEGMVEETLQKNKIPDIAILRLDTDFYSSTITELKTLYPKLVQGGVLIIDDYGVWNGATKATQEYFNFFKNDFPLLIPLPKNGAILVKQHK